MAKRIQTPERSFAARVLAVVRRIPVGRVATYGDVAALAGAPGAARAVGTVLRGCSERATPCHRVVGAGGALGGWTGPMEFKREQLRREGFQIHRTRIQDFESRRWMPAAGPAFSPGRRRAHTDTAERRRSSARRPGPAQPPTL